MAWEVEYTDEFEEWWNALDGDTQDRIAVSVTLLEMRGPIWTTPAHPAFGDRGAAPAYA